MSVLLETSLGDIVIDLYTKECPKTCLNFLKLCKIKYYNNCLFYDVQKQYIAQAGDPENTGRGGNSIFGIINGKEYRYFDDEMHGSLRHNKLGLVSTANFGPNMNTSTFFIQLTDKHLLHMNEKHTVFGRVEEGLDVLDKLNKVFVDKDSRPYQNIRIKHTVILEDPFEDPIGLIVPSQSPELVRDLEYHRLEDDFNVGEVLKDEETEERIQEKLQEHEAKNRTHVLAMLEDLPDAEIKPPENVLFVCKINPVTQDDDLELIFSRFGAIKSKITIINTLGCQIIRDWKTKRSLQYAFIEFENVEACEKAYFKMNGVVIDDRRIKVDFSQSVAKLWFNFKKSANQEFKVDDNSQDLQLPNESKKFEIVTNKNFMNENKNFKMVFDHPEDRDYSLKINRKTKTKSSSPSPKKYKRRSKSRSRSREKKKYRDRSRSGDRKRNRSRSYERRKSRR